MSLLNAWVTPEEAIVAVDTEGVGRDGVRSPMCKIVALAQLGGVIAFRGQSLFFGSVAHICMSRRYQTFDELLDDLPVIVELAASPPQWDVPGFDGNELIAVGWSTKQSRIVARLLTRRGGAHEFTVSEPQGCLAPWDAGDFFGIPTEASAIERIARAQVRWMRETYANPTCGGSLIVCTIKRDAINLETRHIFEPEAIAA